MGLDVKDLEKLASQAQQLENMMDGLIKETIKNKLVDPWTRFDVINGNLMKEIDKAVDDMKRNKGELSAEREKAFDAALKKWRDVNNIAGGLVEVERQAALAQDIYKRADDAAKRI